MSAKPKIVVILGPTASGKSDLAVTIGKRFGGEVVSADSRQIYRGLDIGTGKISRREMQRVPHHLLDIISPKRRFAVSEYAQHATRAIETILRNRKLPIICGGTGYYIDAVINGIVFPDVPPNPQLRKRLEGRTAEELHRELRALDPKRAATIDPRNPRRLIRAIEIAVALGCVPDIKTEKRYEALIIGIAVPHTQLRKRIRQRLLKRIKMGMVAEAKRLHAHGLSWTRMEELGLEYRYLSRYLRGKITRDEMLATIEREISRYARRQMTWWRRDKRIVWFKRSELQQVLPLVKKFLKKDNGV